MRRPKKKKEIKIGKNILQLNSIFRQCDLLTLSKYLLILKKKKEIPLGKGISWFNPAHCVSSHNDNKAEEKKIAQDSCKINYFSVSLNPREKIGPLFWWALRGSSILGGRDPEMKHVLTHKPLVCKVEENSCLYQASPYFWALELGASS